MRWQDTALGRAMPQYGINDGDEPVRVGYGVAPSRSEEGIDWFGDDGVFPQPDKFDAFLGLLGFMIAAAGGATAYAGTNKERLEYQKLVKDYAKFLSQIKTTPVPTDIPEDLIRRASSFVPSKYFTEASVKNFSSEAVKENIFKQVEKAYDVQRILPTKENIDKYNKTLEKFGGKQNFKFDADGDIEGLQPRVNKTLQNIITSNADKLAKYTTQEYSNTLMTKKAGLAAARAEQVREGEKGWKNESKRLARLEKEPGPVLRAVGGTGRGVIRAIDMIRGIGGGGSRLTGR